MEQGSLQNAAPPVKLSRWLSEIRWQRVKFGLRPSEIALAGQLRCPFGTNLTHEDLLQINLQQVFFQSIKKPRRVSPSQRRNKVKCVFWRDMCVPENTSQPANVEIVRRRGTIYAMQQAAIPNVGKGVPFSTG